ncbi:MAG: MepB family protein [Bacteroidota bacterium]
MSFHKETLHDNFYTIKKNVYDPCGLTVAQLNAESESREYGACTFKLNEKKIVFRVSRITPAKTGQFVTIWKRNHEGITEPFSENDEFDFVVISSRRDDHFGQFVFSKQVLIEKGIITSNQKEGKRGIRVYPPWDKPTSRQAEKTQAWQTVYFLPVPDDGTADLALARKLYATS